jgi:hypothetical protein
MPPDTMPPPDGIDQTLDEDDDASPDRKDEESPDGNDEETQARHVASRAELLPEELAVGSDDPQAQAEAILAESEERTEHPDPDAIQ